MEFEWNFFPGFTTLELVREVQKFMSKMGEPEQFQGRIIFMSMFSDIIWGNKDNDKECIANSQLCFYPQKDFQQDVGHSSDLGQKQRGTPLTKKDQEEKWDRVAELMIKFGESGHPESCLLKSKGGGKLSFHFCADGDTIETDFRTIISVNQLGIYGAVSEMCEEYSICQTSTGRLVLAEQSDPFFAPADILILAPTSSVEIHPQKSIAEAQRTR